MMSQDSKEILNCRFAGSIYPTITKAAVSCLIDNLTAAGFHEPTYAIEIANQAGASSVINEIVDNFDYCNEQRQELFEAWDEAIEQLYEW